MGKPTLQVEGFENVYCVGDANNVDETKLAYLGQLQAGVAVNNIKSQAAGKKLTSYQPASATSKYGVMFIPLGPKKGVGAMDKSVMGPGAVRLIKGKGLFTKKLFASANAKAPVVPM